MPTAFTRDRADMEKAIKNGGSVMLPDGRIVTRVEDLPAEGDLAAGDRNRLQVEHDRLDKLVADHTKQRDAVKKQLDAAEKVAAKPPEDAVHADFADLSADDLKQLCEDNDCLPEGRPTKAKMAEALAAQGVKPKA